MAGFCMDKLVNPLSPNINRQILHTGLNTFLIELVGRTCLNISAFHL